MDKETLKEMFERLAAKVNGVLTEEISNDSATCNIILYTNEIIAMLQGIDGPEIRKFIKVRVPVFNCFTAAA